MRRMFGRLKPLFELIIYWRDCIVLICERCVDSIETIPLIDVASKCRYLVENICKISVSKEVAKCH